MPKKKVVVLTGLKNLFNMRVTLMTNPE